MAPSQIDRLKVTADYTNPSGNMSFAQLEQTINDIPVFRGEIKAGFTTDGRIIRVINNLAPGLDYESLSTDFRNPVDAVKAAAGHINVQLPESDLTVDGSRSTNLKTVFGSGDWSPTCRENVLPHRARHCRSGMASFDLGTGQCVLRDRRCDQRHNAVAQEHHGRSDTIGDLSDLSQC
jgi:hypothetical protein